MEQLPTYIRAGQVARMLGIHLSHVTYLHKKGYLLPDHLTESGHRRYTLEQVEEYQERVKRLAETRDTIRELERLLKSIKIDDKDKR